MADSCQTAGMKGNSLFFQKAEHIQIPLPRGDVCRSYSLIVSIRYVFQKQLHHWGMAGFRRSIQYGGMARVGFVVDVDFPVFQVKVYPMLDKHFHHQDIAGFCHGNGGKRVPAFNGHFLIEVYLVFVD